MKKNLLVPLLCLATALAVQAQPSNLLKRSTKTKTKDDTAATQMGEYKGVRHALGIADFTSREGFSFEKGQSLTCFRAKGDATTPSCTSFRVACEQISRLSTNPAAISASSRRASTIMRRHRKWLNRAV